MKHHRITLTNGFRSSCSKFQAESAVATRMNDVESQATSRKSGLGRRGMINARLALFLACAGLLTGCSAATNANTQAAASNSSAAEVKEVSLVWQISTVTDAEELPHTSVGIRTVGAVDKALALGDINAADQGDVTIDGALTARKFWWAGGGAQFAVFQNGQLLTVRKQELEEESSVDLPWVDVGTIELPAGVTVHHAETSSAMSQGPVPVETTTGVPIDL